MNHTSFQNSPGGVRAVDRAMGELRRGVAVTVRADDGERLLALPAETASPATLQEFLAEMAPGSRPVLLVAPSRAAGMAHPSGGAAAGDEWTAIAIPLHVGLLDTAVLRGLANPTASSADFQAAVAGAAEPSAHAVQLTQACLLLAKLGRLLPALLVAPAAALPYAARSSLPGTALLTVAASDILAYPDDTAEGLVLAAEARVPLAEAGDARVVAFRPPDGGTEHLAILIGEPEQVDRDREAPLVRVHSECFTGDLLGSLRCDCGPQLHQAIRRMAAEGAGVLLYMAQEGRGIGLVNKLRAYTLQDGTLPDGATSRPRLDTLDANRALGYGGDERSFAAAATMLRRLGIVRIRLLTNNPDKITGLQAHGIEVTGRVGHAIAANGVNDGYLATKARRFGHLLG